MSRHALVALGVAVCMAWAGAATGQALRVCADPNNLPFSNRAGEGFENRIVELIARDLGAKVSYTWWAQRRGYVRKTLKAERCDLWPGVATGDDMLATTSPYYRSGYVFVSRADRNLDVSSLDDPRLRRIAIGVQMIGKDANNTPPAHALARRRIVENVHGYSVFGDYTQPNPPAAVIDAVIRGDVDIAIAWGPLAGYFAAKAPRAMRVTPVRPVLDAGIWPMQFNISMGLRRNEPVLRQQIEDELRRRRSDIAAILADYHVPLLPTTTPATGK